MTVSTTSHVPIGRFEKNICHLCTVKNVSSPNVQEPCKFRCDYPNGLNGYTESCGFVDNFHMLGDVVDFCQPRGHQFRIAWRGVNTRGDFTGQDRLDRKGYGE